MPISILDCTLRDGGYVNNFGFSKVQVSKIISGLTNARLEYIEVGFLKNSKNEEQTTIYTDIQQIKEFLLSKQQKSSYFAMIVFGTYDIDKLPKCSETCIDGIRVTFKKSEIEEALEYCKKIIQKGYKLCANPTGINSYSDFELLLLLQKINELNPFAFSIVDTLGLMKPQDLIHTYSLVNKNLNKNIAIGYHSHNNLQLSFSNAVKLIEFNSDRTIIIDSCLFGMGRGAGNLCTELLAKYLNEYCNYHYDLLPILKTIDEQINKIFELKPWGYNIPYYLAACSECHPNYSSYLLDKQTISIEAINSILLRIPDNKKAVYDENLIKQLYLDYQENVVDDSDAIENLKQKIGTKPVLVIAPGKSIKENKSEIDNFILSKKPFVVSLNFTPTDYKTDLTFVSNAKRYEEQKEKNNLLITSNIKVTGIPTLNYASYLNNSEMYDNVALIFCVVLMKLGIKQIYFAGMDGFTSSTENYFSKEMINNAKLGEFDKRNEIMKSVLKKFSKQLDIHFITPSLYQD